MSNGTQHPSTDLDLVRYGALHDDEGLRPGIALCLSGGGYRAMLFHLGSLWRLAELDYLRRLDRISSVSGGSITAGVLGLKWGALQVGQPGLLERFVSEVVAPIRGIAGQTVDRGAILQGLFGFDSISDEVVKDYRKYLFGNATLQSLPEHPRFVINATSVQTGALFRFSRAYLADYRVGMVQNPQVELAVAVAASSAFPPVLSPLKLRLKADAWTRTGAPREDLHEGRYLTDVVLTDGGVYDNLGLETAWKSLETVLVSNGGGKISPDEKPESDWMRHSFRVNEVIDNQVRSLRVRQLIAAFKNGRPGTYWGVRSDAADYSAPGTLPCPLDRTRELAATKTRLAEMPVTLQERLINWGYAVCDAAMRSFVAKSAAPPAGFPYPAMVSRRPYGETTNTVIAISTIATSTSRWQTADAAEAVGARPALPVPPPPERRLKVFSLDPSSDSQFEGSLISRSVLPVPWESVEPGPVGEYLEVVDIDPSSGCVYDPVDLNDPICWRKTASRRRPAIRSFISRWSMRSR